MRIGILTFVNTINYGALFQAYALQHVLEKFNANAELIQYVNAFVEKKELNKGGWTWRRLFRLFVIGKSFHTKRQKFGAFEGKYINKGLLLNNQSSEEVANTYDKIIVGSDQVWNQNITHNDDTYFLDFVKNSDKKISYAPSFGNAPFPECRRSHVQSLLADFPKLSVRENSGAELIMNMIGREPKVVLDPTLLLNKDDWTRFVGARPLKDKYILVYFPNNKKKCFDFVRELQSKTGLKVIYLSISPRIQFGVRTIYDASPEEWLTYIYYADYIVTGSFHGTAFSINMEKQFFCENEDINSRIGNITSLTNTYFRNISNSDVLETTVDYKKVTPVLDKMRKESIDWLINAVLNNE